MEIDQIALKALVIVPAYNEERSLPRVLAGIKEKTPGYDVLVVNDGSTDDTSRVAHMPPACYHRAG